jgi:hypothetical protein
MVLRQSNGQRAAKALGFNALLRVHSGRSDRTTQRVHASGEQRPWEVLMRILISAELLKTSPTESPISNSFVSENFDHAWDGYYTAILA